MSVHMVVVTRAIITMDQMALDRVSVCMLRPERAANLLLFSRREISWGPQPALQTEVLTR